MFRALLAAVKPVLSQEFVIDFASALAAQHRLLIDASAVIDTDRLAPAEPVPIGGGAFKAERDEQLVAAARAHAAEVMLRMESASQTRGVACSAQVQQGDTVAILAAAVQRCDLLVCGHTPGGDASERSLLQAILKQCPRPALIVPQAAFAAGEGVLVAYDGSAQAARALASFAASGLADGRPVHIASFDEGAGAAESHAATARTFLQRHGVAAEVCRATVTRDVGSQILEEARRVAAGLVVMGTFGQHSMREYFFGSATRSMLDKLPVPLFVDH